MEYLSRTETFEDALFYRVRRVSAAGSEIPIPLDVNGVLSLDSGVTYDIEFLHAQRAAPRSPQPIELDVDGATLKPIGTGSFSIASRYDLPSMRLVATATNDLHDRETVLSIHATGEVSAPQVTLPVRVRANRREAIGVAVAQTVALVAVALAGALSMLPLGVRIALAVTGAIVAAGLQLVGTSILRSPSMPSASQPPPPASGHAG